VRSWLKKRKTYLHPKEVAVTEAFQIKSSANILAKPCVTDGALAESRVQAKEDNENSQLF
jgi:hypothetical protein